MRDTDVAPKCAAFLEARRDYALAAADYFKIAGRNFEVELELLWKNDYLADVGWNCYKCADAPEKLAMYSRSALKKLNRAVRADCADSVASRR
ncbi:MAG: hypothetical protein LBQ86_09390 [Holophagales bacterium]|jgi:hypothetical protein|nr:hypothetical protein [Holophagales bacterium]